MVRRNSIEASTRSSMADSSDDDSIHGAELTADPIIAKMKMFEGQLMSFSHAQTDVLLKVNSMEARLDAKVDSLEEKMDANFNELRRTLTQLSNQLGKRPIEPETSRQQPPVTNFPDPYVRDDLNRLPLDNRKSLLRKIDMPKFDGSNAYDWLSKVERFFRVGRYSDFDKLDLVSLSLEGDVLKWFNWELIRKEFRSWEDFRRRLFRRFGAAPEQSPGNRLFALKQTGTVSAYVTEFEELSAQVVGLDDLHLEQIFYNGLKTEMREVLKLKEPIGLENQKNAVLRMETSSFCQLFPEKHSKPWEGQKNFTSKPMTAYAQPQPLLLQNGENQRAGQVTTTPAPRPNAAGVQPRQRHTAEELDAMRSNGICFKCKGRYSRDHKCPLKELQILTVVNGIELEVIDGEYSDSEDVTVDQNPTLCCLSLNSFLSSHSPKTNKLVGWMGNSRVLILLDSGASHNFITPSVVSKLNLQVSLDTNMAVLWANGTSVQSNGTCRNVQFQMSGVPFQSDFISLELGGVDIILGMQWLETLGTCVVDWKKQEWSFVHAGKQVKLVGDPSLHVPPLLLQPVEVPAQPLCSLQEQRDVPAGDIYQPHRSTALSPAVGLDRFSNAAHFGRLKTMLHMGPFDGRHNHIIPPLETFAVQNQYLPTSSRPVCTFGGQIDHVIFQLQSSVPVIFEEELLAVLGAHQQVQSSALPEMLPEDLWIPAAMLEVKFDEFGCLESLIQWQDHDASENTASKLEDKLVFEGGSIDTTLQTYHRKNKKKMVVEVDVVAGLLGFKRSLELKQRVLDTKKLWDEKEGLPFYH